jgi:acetoacetate decarboxylase
MKQEIVVKQLTTLIGALALLRGPFRVNNREYLNILYRIDIDALRAVVPEPLEIDEPLVR